LSSIEYKYNSISLLKFLHQIKKNSKELKKHFLNQTKQKKLLKPFHKTKQIKMNQIIAKPVVIVASEVTEKPIDPTNQCSIMARPIVIVASEVTEKPINPTNQCSIM
jgi:hypothetical protein